MPFVGFPQFPPGFPFNEQKEGEWSNKNLNDQLKLTKKCYKMVEKLGGSPAKYEDFVKQRLDKRFPEIFEEYLKENNIDAKKFDQEKIDRKSRKLGFYYKKDPIYFREIVKDNIDKNLQQLIKIIDEKYKKPEEEIKVEEKVVEKPSEEKKEPVVVVEEKKEEAPKENQKKPINPVDIEQNVLKKQEVILAMKEMLGEENVFNYVQVFEANKDKSLEQIVDIYLNSVANKK